MNEPITVRKRPVEVQAMRWDGSNVDVIDAWSGGCFLDLDERDRATCDDPEATAQVLDKLHSTWVLVYTGDWIIRGVKGEFYPCRDEVFAETYEQVPA